MSIKRLEETPLAITAAELENCFKPFIVRHCGDGDESWRRAVAKRDRRVRQTSWHRGLLRFLPPARREARQIEREYSQVWRGIDFGFYRLSPPPSDRAPWEWRERRWIASRFGGARVRLMLAMRAIELTRPRSVLEVGSGNGVNLLFLAGRFPATRFAGLELTSQGVAAAHAFQAAHARFPAANAAYSPYRMRDETAFRRVTFTQGSAQHLPFPDGSFDLVMTVLALEQMESIRGPALREIARVARRHVLMIEPFFDLNARGRRRRYVDAHGYLRARVRDLADYGLRVQWATADFPQKAAMAATCVLAARH
ncbi:MAG: class I SAM-dependent methyltransferase [Reyranellaceae bacterium]